MELAKAQEPAHHLNPKEAGQQRDPSQNQNLSRPIPDQKVSHRERQDPWVPLHATRERCVLRRWSVPSREGEARCNVG